MPTPSDSPSPLTLPPSVGAPVKNRNNPNSVQLGYAAVLNLGPTFKRVNDERYTTPPRKRTVQINTKPQRKKK